jgi:AcrR family transcriptional regulator
MTPADPAATPRRGRPRDANAEQAILAATVDLLAEVGFSNLSVEAVAARAGVGRPTVYRRWPAKLELVIDAVIRLAPPLTVEQVGEPRADLLALVTRLVVELTSTSMGRAVLALTGEAGNQPELAGRWTQDYLAPRRAALAAVLRRAVESGALRPDVDVELLLDFVLGAPMYRWFTTGRPVTAVEARTMVEAVWEMARAR